MKRSIQFVLMAILVVCNMAAQEIARVELKEFDSELFPFKRPVLIYTPQEYDECTGVDYDVIYVFDAQSRALFDEVQALLHFGVQQPRADRRISWLVWLHQLCGILITAGTTISCLFLRIGRWKHHTMEVLISSKNSSKRN